MGPFYTGAYRALNFDIFADLLEKNGMSSRARDFLMASGHLQALCYKLEMERNLRTPGYTGFQLLGLNDYSGQGTALVGVLNAFWREKGYITARQWRESCGPVVIMAALPRFVYTQGETLSADILLYNAFAPLKPTQVRWRLLNEDSTVCRQDSFLTAKIPLNKINILGHITLPFDSLTLGGRTLPRRFHLSLSADNVITNSYDLWVYPSQQELEKSLSSLSSSSGNVEGLRSKVIALPPTGSLLPTGGVGEGPSIASTLTPEAIETLRKGGTVLLTAAGKVRYAILQYMSSKDFRPSLTLTPDQIRHFYDKDEPPVNLFTNQSPDELKPKFAN